MIPTDRPISLVKGFGKIYFNDSFGVNNISVIQGKDSVFVSIQSYKIKQTNEQGKAVYQDACYLVAKEFRRVMLDAIVNIYEAVQERGNVYKVSEQNEFIDVGIVENTLPIR